MITNSSIQILLRQSPTSVDLVQQTFKLSDEEKYLLLESDVGEGIFFAGLKHVAVKVIASYTEDQIITSDPSQILAIRKAKRELEDTEEAMRTDAVSTDRMPKGESSSERERALAMKKSLDNSAATAAQAAAAGKASAAPSSSPKVVRPQNITV